MTEKRSNPRKALTRLREERLLTKAELARRAGLSTLTVHRVEQGLTCRMDTKRKILKALGMKIQDKEQVFGGRQDVDQTDGTEDEET